MKTLVEVEVELQGLDIDPEDLADYVVKRGEVEYDIDFLNKYLPPFLNQAGIPLEEAEEVFNNLNPKAKEVLKKIAEMIK